jgi:NurA domain
MQGMSQYLSHEAKQAQLRLARATQLLNAAAQQQTHLMQLQTTWGDRLLFTAATPLESLQTNFSVSSAPTNHTVLATDGSQISPNHHEIAYCYLLNIGRIALHYGQNRLPLLDSQPEVFYRRETIYLARQWGIRPEEWMGYCRTIAEAQALAKLGATRCATSPTLAMVDGSLIYWFLESLPTEAREQILPPILAAWDHLRQQDIPLVGYISASRSSESLNFLRLQACPYTTPDCQSHCQSQSQSDSQPGQESAADRTGHLPCQQGLDPLRDSQLWATRLAPGERSPLWRSSARIGQHYGEHLIHFCYLHTGSEIARVEMPAWVSENRNTLDLALAMVLAQAHKGQGYPVALAEAHNQAVVRGGDRTRFFALLEEHLIQAGLQNVGTSYKEARKRGSIA